MLEFSLSPFHAFSTHLCPLHTRIFFSEFTTRKKKGQDEFSKGIRELRYRKKNNEKEQEK